jgi:hypothetical protein
MPVKKGAVCPKIAALAKSFVQTPRIFLHQFQWTVVGFVTHFLTVSNPVAEIEIIHA